jgi:YegS/Rv2252/BmrU family lipid kinase
MIHRKTTVILNPVSAGGRTYGNKEKIEKAIRNLINDRFELIITRAPQESTILTMEAIKSGSELILVAGGDGTIQEVVNGFLTNDKNKQCLLGIISSGTGQGFAQSLGLPNTLDEQIDIALGGTARKVDVGKVTFMNFEGSTSHRYFINECQLGIGSTVVQRVQQNHKLLGGKLGFGLGTIEAVVRHPNQSIKVTIDEGYPRSTSLTGIVIANGAYTGGGMNLAPGACVDDGWLNLLLMQEMSVAERLWSFPKIYSGKHIRLDKFKYQRIQSISVESSEKVCIEADGELLGTAPCKVEIIPASLMVQCR